MGSEMKASASLTKRLNAIISSTKTSPRDVVAAARALRQIDADQAVSSSSVDLERISRADLERLAARLAREGAKAEA